MICFSSEGERGRGGGGKEHATTGKNRKERVGGENGEGLDRKYKKEREAEG